jgi:hypothetical protein
VILHPLRNNYWVRRGYVTGTCMYHSELKKCYINIPKNASSFIRETFKDVGWKHMHLGMHMDIDNYIVILRDPIERWITGIAQHITSNVLGENFGSTHYLEQNNELVNRLIFDQVVFDDHTEQQSWFLEPFDLKDAVFFYCDANLNRNLDSYFANRFQLMNKPYVNTSASQFDNSNLVKHFKTLVYNNKTYYNRIKSYFLRDYDLINSVNFYGTRQSNS